MNLVEEYMVNFEVIATNKRNKITNNTNEAPETDTLSKWSNHHDEVQCLPS